MWFVVGKKEHNKNNRERGEKKSVSPEGCEQSSGQTGQWGDQPFHCLSLH